ncbi:hypothetical protein GCM10009846_21770 [Agrococcus versicolor]|uniref:Replicase polyprotein 1ab n=1 Tax=Agrococcus versicolor TaxID=501482 RepID=A0ABN3ATY0_9MICO
MRDDFDAPAIPADVQASDLAGEARMQLKTLAKDNADDVARHLAMVARLIDDDPKAAHEHALAASRRAGRIGVVRETLAITAYQLEDFGLALRELRTFRRITGSDEQLPLMVDCERGLGRPEKALELSRSVDASTLPTPVRVELAIARSGARLDLGQTQSALDELRIPELQRDVAHSYSPALFAAYANVLEDLGKADEAAEWHALADRAIDALEAAADPGETETVQVAEEWIDIEGEAYHHDVDETRERSADDVTDEDADDRADDALEDEPVDAASEHVADADMAGADVAGADVADADRANVDVDADVADADVDADVADVDADAADADADAATDAPDADPSDDGAAQAAESEAGTAEETVDTSVEAIEAEVEELLREEEPADATESDVESTPAATSAPAAEADVALFAIDPEDAGEPARVAAEPAAEAVPMPDAPAHEADATDHEPDAPDHEADAPAPEAEASGDTSGEPRA